MGKGKIIVIEGTDCSGKETQTIKLLDRLLKEQRFAERKSFPNYNSPTGKIIGGPYLGKQYITNGWFKEGAMNVNPAVASLYYAADRLYNIGEIKDLVKKGFIVIIDRYISSNMAHQGGKILDKKRRYAMYNWLDELEYKLCKLPKPDITFFLHLPYEYSLELRKKRKEEADQHEISEEHLKHAEQAYLELAKLYKWQTIKCVKDNKIRSIDDIHAEIYNILEKEL